MGKQVKLAILRLRHDTSVPTVPDAACLEMLWTGRQSVLQYWRDTTYGHLDFVGSALMPWTDVVLPAGQQSRQAQTRAAITALREANPGADPLAGFDGVVVLVHPGTVTIANPRAGQAGQPPTVVVGHDAGATDLADGRGVAVIPTAGNHTFYCHEVGHVLGLRHSYGVDNNGADWDPDDGVHSLAPVYGDPYDIMSSAAFGSRWLGTGPTWTAAPVFAGTPVPGWPTTGTVGSLGPHLSRAALHLYWPEALGSRVVDRSAPPPGGAVRQRLRATVPSSRARQLLVVHPPGEGPTGAGRLYVEVRLNEGWDAGMDYLGDVLDRVGVVVHTLEDVPDEGLVVWYRGTLPLFTPDADLAVPGTPYVVSLDGWDGEAREADLRLTVGTTRTVTVTPGRLDEVIVGSTHEEPERTPCGDPVVRGRWVVATTARYAVSSTGLGGGGRPLAAPVTVTWTLNGATVPVSGGTVQVPVGDETFDVRATVDPLSFELTLDSDGGLQLGVDVVAEVTDGTATLTARNRFEPRGWYDGYRPEDQQTVSDCLRQMFDRFDLQEPPLLRRPDPGPLFLPHLRTGRRALDERLGRAWHRRATEAVRSLEGVPAEGVAALERLVQMQLLR